LSTLILLVGSLILTCKTVLQITCTVLVETLDPTQPRKKTSEVKRSWHRLTVPQQDNGHSLFRGAGCSHATTPVNDPHNVCRPGLHSVPDSSRSEVTHGCFLLWCVCCS